MIRYALLGLLLISECSDRAAGKFPPLTAPKSPPLCDVEAGTESFASLKSMPQALVRHFVARLEKQTNRGFLPIADRDKFFFDTDVVDSSRSSFRRFIQGGHSGPLWVIANEVGGFAPHVEIFVYGIDSNSTEPRFISSQQIYFGSRCAAFNAALAEGVFDAG